MNYRVFWYPDAQRYLDALLEASEHPEKITAAAQAIDRQLVADPFDFGESRSERVRIGFEGPLAVQFHVLRDVNTVIVYSVWRTDRNRH